MNRSSSAVNDISIVLAGEAGQGIQTIEQLLTKILKFDGFYIHATKEYMSRVRGGTNSTSIRVASKPIAAPLQRIDLLLPLDKKVVPRLQARISEKTMILGDSDVVGQIPQMVHIPFKKMAMEIGNQMYENTIALGVILGLLESDIQVMKKYLAERFYTKGEDVVAKNISAAQYGYERGVILKRNEKVLLAEIVRHDSSEEIVVNGTEAIALGAVAGGCKCIISYPMTPGTGVITFMAKHQGDFDLLVEQAEDEICAINMALGAWYAGTRAMVTTSGGGFALMAEGVSLAGMLEMPVVIHLAQRPGPATGLPTRTEQGDLDLALYAGHGEFPRIILAPDSLQSAFSLSRRAFELADEFQVPVIILSDQYLVDTYYNTAAFDLFPRKTRQYLVKTDDDYQRYRFTSDGVSPRGIPGKGTGLVGVDSDEHDEAGHITEDFAMRVKMVDKRLQKLVKIKRESPQIKRKESESAQIIIVSWGSTNMIVREAVTKLEMNDVFHIPLEQVYPLPGNMGQFLEKARKTIIIENNATSQMGRLIQRETGHHFHSSLLKYNGLPFGIEELIDHLQATLRAEE